MTKDIFYIIKRIIIVVGSAIILMLIKSNFLCLPVYARTTIQSGVAVGIPNDTTLEDYDNKYYTNIYYNPELSYRDITALQYGMFTYNGTYSYDSVLRDINESVDLRYMSGGASIYFFKIALGGSSGYNTLDFDTQYSIALKFTKDSNLAWYGLPISRDYYRFNIYDLDNSTLLDSDTFVKIDSVGFHTYEQDNNQNNGVFIITFHLDSNDYIYSSEHLSLNTLVYSYYGFNQQTHDPILPNANSSPHFSILTNMNTSFQSTKSFINKQLYFVKGNILPYGAYCTDSIDHVGCGITGDNPFPDSSGMDIIHDTDIEIMDELPTCDNLDIPCHINRVVKSIQDLFIRFGNFFREFINNLYTTFTDLFIPSSDYLTTYINDTISLIRQKLGFLEYPIELLVSLLNRFNNLTKQTTINYPGTNTKIIPPFTFNFDTIINDNSYISTLYNYYFIIMNGFLCLCFIRLCRKKLISLGLGG